VDLIRDSKLSTLERQHDLGNKENVVRKPSPVPTMILGPISFLDCIVFCIFLTPALLLNVGLVDTVLVAFSTLPFLRECLIPCLYYICIFRMRTEQHVINWFLAMAIR
jgi:hypothetical protein